MNSRERLHRIFYGLEVDRPALKLWGYIPKMEVLHNSYNEVTALAEQFTDVFSQWSGPFNLIYGAELIQYVSREEKNLDDPLWYDIHITVNAPAGKLHSVYRESRVASNMGMGYWVEHLIKSPEDMLALLSIPYSEQPVKVEGYLEEDRRIGEKGITVLFLPHAGYGLQDLCGSENLALFYADAPEIMHQFIGEMALRIKSYTKKILDSGVRPYFAWVGPEVFIPPLASPQMFEEFVFNYDKPLCDLIHNADCRVWMHCHGKVRQFMDRFIDMGIDIINPLEPPKNGDIDMYELANTYAGRIGLEGNIEIQDIIMSPGAELKLLIEDCVNAGKQSGRFILCPSSGFNDYVTPTRNYIENLKTYIAFGYECVNKR